VLAGGGIQGGAIYGASDEIVAFPADKDALIFMLPTADAARMTGRTIFAVQSRWAALRRQRRDS
jgi:hypothetical protein